MLKKIFHDIEHHFEEMVAIRRYLHQHPEVSFHEYETAKYIANYYETLQIPYQTNVGGNGVIATLKGGKPGKTVAFRADFDALPIQDEKDVPYKSKVPGVMHACAHDGHTATLLVFAKILQKYQAELPGTLVFVHQHAEELPPGGAVEIVKSGVLDAVDVIFGNHLWTPLPLGTFATRTGVFMGGADRFTITVHGAGGHGAYPQATKDALVVGAEIVQKLQTIVSRKLHPLDGAVVTVGEFQAGTAFNIIANEATLQGTVRYLEENVQQKIKAEIERIVKGICLANDVTYTYEYADGHPPVVNEEAATELVYECAGSISEITERKISPPQMVGEDFAYYLQKIPGAFFYTGAKKVDSDYPHHHPLFDFDERAMPIAAKLFAKVFFTYQAKHTGQ